MNYVTWTVTLSCFYFLAPLRILTPLHLDKSASLPVSHYATIDWPPSALQVTFENFKDAFVAVLSRSFDLSTSEDDSSYLEPGKSKWEELKGGNPDKDVVGTITEQLLVPPSGSRWGQAQVCERSQALRTPLSTRQWTRRRRDQWLGTGATVASRHRGRGLLVTGRSSPG